MRHSLNGGRAARRALLLACTFAGVLSPLEGIASAALAQSVSRRDPPPLRSALPEQATAAAAERRARALIAARADPSPRSDRSFLSGAALRTARDSFLPGVGGLIVDRGPANDGAVRRAYVPGDGILAGSGVGAGASAGPVESVVDAMRGALAVNEGIQASLHRAEAAAHELSRAKAAMLPKLTLGAEIGSGDVTKHWRENRSGRGEIVLAMPLFASGANINAVREARARRDVAELTVLAEGRREMLRAATAYLDVASAKQVVDALIENVRGMETTAAAARALARAGEAGLTDVSLAEANLAAARGELAAGEEALQKARIEHRSLTGRDSVAKLAMPDTSALVPRDVESVVAGALARSPDAKAGWRNADAQRYAARAAYGSIGPSVSLTGSVGRDYARNEIKDGWDEWDTAIGVRLSVPLIDAEALPRVRGARAQARAAEWDARDTAREIERRVRVAHAVHASAVDRQKHAERRVRSIRSALAATRAEYAAGFLAITDVTRAQVDLARARIELANLERDRHRAAYTVALAAEIPIEGF